MMFLAVWQAVIQIVCQVRPCFQIPFPGTFQGRGSLYIKGHLARRTAKCQKIPPGFLASPEMSDEFHIDFCSPLQLSGYSCRDVSPSPRLLTPKQRWNRLWKMSNGSCEIFFLMSQLAIYKL